MLTTTAKLPNIQDTFLAAARRSAAHVTVFLMNGYQMRGVIHAFDPYAVSYTHLTLPTKLEV